MDVWVVGNAVFSQDLWFDLVGPVNLNDGVVVGKHQEEVVIKVARIYSHFGVSWISTIPSHDQYGLLIGDIELDNSRMEIKNVYISEVDFEISNGKWILM